MPICPYIFSSSDAYKIFIEATDTSLKLSATVKILMTEPNWFPYLVQFALQLTFQWVLKLILNVKSAECVFLKTLFLCFNYEYLILLAIKLTWKT